MNKETCKAYLHQRLDEQSEFDKLSETDEAREADEDDWRRYDGAARRLHASARSDPNYDPRDTSNRPVRIRPGREWNNAGASFVEVTPSNRPTRIRLGRGTLTTEHPIWDLNSTIAKDQIHIAQKGTHAERHVLLDIHNYKLSGHALAALSLFGDDAMRARIANMHDWSSESSDEDNRIRNEVRGNQHLDKLL